jgi:hypothetical protein
MLDSFLEVPIDKLRKAPNILYVRAIMSLVTIMKADYAVGTDADMGELLESQNLKVCYYLDAVLKKTSEAMGPQKCRNPSHWNFLLEAKLKSWWDEYQEWRNEGRHLKRRKTESNEQTPVFTEPKAPDTAPSNFQSSTVQQQQPPLMQNYPMNSPYPTSSSWNTNDLHLNTNTPAQPMGGQTAFTPDMGDFSAAFQHGDLYLWNDMNADNFGGWVPQSGPYSGMDFGGMDGQGF